MTNTTYNIAILGAGAAGTMAAIKASGHTKGILLIDRNASLGKKILITGNGRCNLTNTASPSSFVEKFAQSGPFLRTAFFYLTSEELVEFFTQQGLDFKTEEDGKIFPVTDKARSITSTLEHCLHHHQVNLSFNTTIVDIKKEGNTFLLLTQNNQCIKAKKLIIATGGSSYPSTGSDGTATSLLKNLGHHPIPFRPALIPLKTSETWVKDLQGLSFQNVFLSTRLQDKKITRGPGDILFTHFGLSGPLIIDLSAMIISELEHCKELRVSVDLAPSLSTKLFDEKMIRSSITQGNAHVDTLLNTIVPKRMTVFLLNHLKIDHAKPLNQITKKERLAIIATVKELPLTITDSLPIAQAMATNGGIPLGEIHPKTMESKIVPGLYFAGEVIDGRGPSGGYNLQQAFSTGSLAGNCAAKDLNTQPIKTPTAP